MRDRLVGEVDAGDRGGGSREQIAAVAFAARGVEHTLARHDRRNGRVAVPVLVLDGAAHFRQETLAGESEGRRFGRGRGQVSTGGWRRMRPEDGGEPIIVAVRRRPGG
jgi:hypothetical protein